MSDSKAAAPLGPDRSKPAAVKQKARKTAYRAASDTKSYVGNRTASPHMDSNVVSWPLGAGL